MSLLKQIQLNHIQNRLNNVISLSFQESMNLSSMMNKTFHDHTWHVMLYHCHYYVLHQDQLLHWIQHGDDSLPPLYTPTKLYKHFIISQHSMHCCTTLSFHLVLVVVSLNKTNVDWHYFTYCLFKSTKSI